MKSQALLVSCPNTNWPVFTGSCKDVLGRSVTKELDKLGMNAESVAGYVACLGELSNPGKKPYEHFSDPSLLRHLFFTFLIATDRETLNDFLKRATSVLSVTTAPTSSNELILSVVTGNMQDWFFASLACCSGNETFELRRLFDSIVLFFENMGLGRVFERCSKTRMPDNTFKMIEK